jgi:hypothetical protein
MAQFEWTPVAAAAAFQTALPWTIGAPWLVALEKFGEGNLLRIQVTGRWTPINGLPGSGPDGLAGLVYPDTALIVSDCPVGALIGRIGGSSATLKAAGTDNLPGEGKAFAVGSYCVVKIADEMIGPLFLGFNCLPRPVVVSAFTLDLAMARV